MFLIEAFMKFIRKTIKTKINFDIQDLDLKEEAKLCNINALILHSKND